MATIGASKKITPISIDKFLGLNISNTGDTQIKNGESGNMTNFYITNDYKLKKMYGYKQVYNFQHTVQGEHYTNINGVNYFLFASNGHLYYFLDEILMNEELWNTPPTLIGDLQDKPTTFFDFDNKVYILNGEQYLSWDGTNLKEVEGYIPLVFISTPPAGGGTEFEAINLLTGKKHQTFNGNGTDKVFHLAEKGLNSVDKVILNAEEITTGYTVDLVQGTVTFETAPIEAMDNVDIYWTKGQGERHFIEKMRAGILFGGDTDTKVFLYGNPDEQNRIRYSSTANNVPSVEYFPGWNQVDVGANNFAVTDLRRHYDRLLVTTNKPDAYYISIDLIDIDGVTTPSVRTLPLNEVRGNVAFNQGQVINNDPVTIDNAIIRWKSTNVRDERNMEEISSKIQEDLKKIDLRYCKTIDNQRDNQLWISNGNRVYIYNYFNDTYSRVNLSHEIDSFCIADQLYFVTVDGKLMKFSEDYQTFNGETIKAHWEMNFSDFGAEYLRKTMNRLWVLLQPQTKSSAEIGYITNRNELVVKKHIEYSMVLLDNVDFSDFSFSVSNNPQPFRLKMTAQKFTNLKIVIENNEDTDATILSLALKVEAGGESK